MKLHDAIVDVLNTTDLPVPSYRALLAHSRAILRQDAEVSLLGDDQQILIEDTTEDHLFNEEGKDVSLKLS